MARPSSAGCSGPDPAAWLRSSRSPCSASSSAASPTLRFAPTPVVRPYTGRRVATSRAVSQAARAAGCPVLLVTYGYNHGQPVRGVDADGFIDTLADVAAVR